jgi:hypothetical protein
MINFERIGIGIITHNRKESYRRLIDSIKTCDIIDYVITVKDGNIEYNDAEPNVICNEMIFNDNKPKALYKYFQNNEQKSIAYNKNLALKELMSFSCDHIFIIEDDILIKNVGVFKEYIDTAKAFNLEHLNFCRAFDSKIPNNYQQPFLSVQNNNKQIEIFRKLNGCFSYFSLNALKKVGLYDEKYINVIEHCEHTYRMSLFGFYTPFYSFADIANSRDFIEDTGIQTSIQHDIAYTNNMKKAYMHFLKTYGKKLIDVKIPTQEEIFYFLKNKIII